MMGVVGQPTPYPWYSPPLGSSSQAPPMPLAHPAGRAFPPSGPVSAQIIDALDGIIEQAVAAKRRLIALMGPTQAPPLSPRDAVRQALQGGRPLRTRQLAAAIEAVAGVKLNRPQVLRVVEEMRQAGEVSVHPQTGWVRLLGGPQAAEEAAAS